MTVFAPPRLLRGPHIQSLLAKDPLRRRRVLSSARELLQASRDEVLHCGDGVRLLAHHTPPNSEGDGRIAILIHGWEGNANSTYILSLATALWRAGFRVFRLNLRDHGGSHHLNEEMFHSCRLAEVSGAVGCVQKTFPHESISLAGFSLGGNFALRVAAHADEGDLQIRRVVAVCPVLDPAKTMDALDGGWPIYRLYFLAKWKASMRLKQEAFPEVYDFPELSEFRTLKGMTDFFVRRYTDYPDLRQYLQGYAITEDRLANLGVNTSVLLAEDDPVIPIADLIRVARPQQLTIDRSEFGGHCGFIGNAGSGSWLDSYFLDRLA